MVRYLSVEPSISAFSPINDAPQLIVPGTQTLNEDSPWAIRGISISDPDAGNHLFESGS